MIILDQGTLICVEESCHASLDCREKFKSSPGSRLRTSTDSLRGEILSAATTHSALRPRLYSTRKAVMGEPPLALGIQVTYTELSVAMEMVGRSGASGTGTETNKEQLLSLCKESENWQASTLHPNSCTDGTSSQRKEKKKTAWRGGMCTYCLGS